MKMWLLKDEDFSLDVSCLVSCSQYDILSTFSISVSKHVFDLSDPVPSSVFGPHDSSEKLTFNRI